MNYASYKIAVSVIYIGGSHFMPVYCDTSSIDLRCANKIVPMAESETSEITFR